jgi:hypothetical protein
MTASALRRVDGRAGRNQARAHRRPDVVPRLGDRGPWPTWPKPDQLDFTHLSRKMKEVIRAADLRDELSFTSFRHGGLTETGDAELTDREILAQSRIQRSRCYRSM